MTLAVAQPLQRWTPRWLVNDVEGSGLTGHHLPGWTEEIHKKHLRVACLQAFEPWTPEYKAVKLPMQL
jgi:hypothetical protein